MMDADSDSPNSQEGKCCVADLSKKRPNGSASKTPVSAQKAKYGTPEKKERWSPNELLTVKPRRLSVVDNCAANLVARHSTLKVVFNNITRQSIVVSDGEYLYFP
ncbi:hypothetical protein K1719_018061 [Acacia pycnantha]|nr:hypothetical protein K1719_018061 [Acacia pycnantha]